MKKDLIITTISSNYSWNDIKNWVISIRKTTFTGEVTCICYNFKSLDDEMLVKLRNEYQVNTLLAEYDFYGNKTDFVWNSGWVNKQNSHLSICNARHFHIWQYLNETGIENYNRIIQTDSRDVVFQTNPTEWLDKNLKKEILLGSEMVSFQNQQWNANNALRAFGPFVFEYILKDKLVNNAGSFAVDAKFALDFFITEHFMTCHAGFSDQSALNLLSNTVLKDKVQIAYFVDGWSLQVGAVGENNIHNNAHLKDGIIYDNTTKTPYCLVHQYDRQTEWKTILDKYYE